MSHLSYDEMSRFATMQNLSEENMEMASVVATHIRACKECREKLNALLKVKELVSDITRPSSVRRHAEK